MWLEIDSRTQRHMWVEFVVGSLLCSKRFFSRYSGFPLSSKTNISKFQFDPDFSGQIATLWRCSHCKFPLPSPSPSPLPTPVDVIKSRHFYLATFIVKITCLKMYGSKEKYPGPLAIYFCKFPFCH